MSFLMMEVTGPTQLWFASGRTVTSPKFKLAMIWQMKETSITKVRIKAILGKTLDLNLTCFIANTYDSLFAYNQQLLCCWVCVVSNFYSIKMAPS